MAYYDENGRIMIDEAAANRDISKLQAAQEILNRVIAAFQQLNSQAAEGQGETARALSDKSQEMIARISRTVQQMDDAKSTIRTTVAKYREIDRALREMINASE